MSSFHKSQIVTQTLQNCLIPNVNGYPGNEYQDFISDVTRWKIQGLLLNEVTHLALSPRMFCFFYFVPK